MRARRIGLMSKHEGSPSDRNPIIELAQALPHPLPLSGAISSFAGYRLIPPRGRHEEALLKVPLMRVTN